SSQLEKEAFLLAGVFICSPRGTHGLALRYFGDGDVPPRFITRNSLVIGSLDDNYGRMCLQPSLRQRRLELFPRFGPCGPRPQACGVAGKIDSQQFTIIRFPPTVPIICAHAIVAATPAEPSNA